MTSALCGLCGLVLLGLLCCRPGQGLAAEKRFNPAITVTGSYDDNIFFDQASDYFVTTSPSLSLELIGERSSLSLSASATDYRYLDNSEYDRTNHSYGLGLSQALSETVSASLSGRFAVDNSFDSFLEETGIVTDKQKRYTYGGSPSLSWQVTERSSLQLGGSYSGVEYEDEDDPGSQGQEAYGANCGLSYQLTARTALTGSLSGSYIEVDDEERVGEDPLGNPVIYGQQDQEQQVYQATLGLDSSLTENLSLAVSGGASYSRVEYREILPVSVGDVVIGTISREVDEGEWGGVADISLSWQREYVSFSLSGGRSISQNPEGDNITVDRASLSMSADLTRNLQFSVRGGFARSERVESRAGQDQEDVYTSTVSPSLSYALGRYGRLECGYTFRTVDDDQGGESSNTAFISFNYGLPVLL